MVLCTTYPPSSYLTNFVSDVVEMLKINEVLLSLHWVAVKVTQDEWFWYRGLCSENANSGPR